MIYLQLFVSFFKVGLFAFGGGYAALPLIQEQVISENAWLSMNEFTHLVTISQMTPGPIALNAATFVGTKVARSECRGVLSEMSLSGVWKRKSSLSQSATIVLRNVTLQQCRTVLRRH